jgi:hypothetical protein
VAFPGFAPAFNAAWPTKPRTTITAIDQLALSRALHIANRHEAIKAAVDLYVTPLLTATARMEDPRSFWFVVIPEEVYELGSPLSRVSAKERIQGEVQMTKDQALKLEAEPTLFGLEQAEADIYRYSVHFRRQLKGIPTVRAVLRSAG